MCSTLSPPEPLNYSPIHIANLTPSTCYISDVPLCGTAVQSSLILRPKITKTMSDYTYESTKYVPPVLQLVRTPHDQILRPPSLVKHVTYCKYSMITSINCESGIPMTTYDNIKLTIMSNVYGMQSQLFNQIKSHQIINILQYFTQILSKAISGSADIILSIITRQTELRLYLLHNTFSFFSFFFVRRQREQELSP